MRKIEQDFLNWQRGKKHTNEEWHAVLVAWALILTGSVTMLLGFVWCLL